VIRVEEHGKGCKCGGRAYLCKILDEYEIECARCECRTKIQPTKDKAIEEWSFLLELMEKYKC